MSGVSCQLKGGDIADCGPNRAMTFGGGGRLEMDQKLPGSFFCFVLQNTLQTTEKLVQYGQTGLDQKVLLFDFPLVF